MGKIKPLDQVGQIAANADNYTAKVNKILQTLGSIMEELVKFASSVPDFRMTGKGNFRHALKDIIMLMVFGRASGCVMGADIIEYGKFNLNKLRKMGMLGNGVPSASTLCRVEKGMDDLGMADRMQEFTGIFYTELSKTVDDRDIIYIDGKAERGTVLENGRNPDIVGAFSFNTGIILATEACKEKSNEIKAVPLLLKKIGIRGKIVTADAMSMQKEIIDVIREKGGDFLIELKANQRSLRYGVEDRLRERNPLYSYTEGPELGHDRIETRTYHVYDGLDIIADKERWGGNMTVIAFEAETIAKSTGELTRDTRLYVTSLPVDTPKLGSIVRKH